MVSYADFHRMPARRSKAMAQGLHDYLGIPEYISVYLDNGAFYFLSREGEMPRREYEEFVEKAKPDWWPIPQDFIPVPKMTLEEQRSCFTRTMQVNTAYQADGFVPIIHISRLLNKYTSELKSHPQLLNKPKLALGGIVPNLLRAPKAMPYHEILESLRVVRKAFKEKDIHVFGVGGTATLHIAALLGFDSVDSSGWRNRAARGMIQLPGSGERMVAELGNWRGRRPSDEEWERLRECNCPACQAHGVEGLVAHRSFGFCNRATHNLWVILEEVKLIEKHIADGSYSEWYPTHLDNTVYRPLIDQLVKLQS